MDADALRDLVRRALDEDRAREDITTIATVDAGARGRATLLAKQDHVIAGLAVFDACFAELDPDARIEHHAEDGDPIDAGTVVAVVEGSLRAILSAERTALNFVQRLSGVATLARMFVAEAEGHAQIKDTRKTTPLLRSLEKEAVLAGGGVNHRATLADAILIKDNHIVAAGGIDVAIKRARETGRVIEVECDTLDQVRAAVDAGADEVLLDNMDVRTLSEAVAIARGRARTEASGGVTLDTVRAIAHTGVDSISVGALTHSAPAIDLSLEVQVV